MQIFYFLSRPSVYTLPGTWEKQPLIKHGNYAWTSTRRSDNCYHPYTIVFGYRLWNLHGFWTTYNKNLTDPWDEHDD